MKHISEILPRVLEDAANPDADLRRCGLNIRPIAHCPRCDRDVALLVAKRGDQIRGDCPGCEKFLKWIDRADLDRGRFEAEKKNRA